MNKDKYPIGAYECVIVYNKTLYGVKLPQEEM